MSSSLTRCALLTGADACTRQTSPTSEPRGVNDARAARAVRKHSEMPPLRRPLVGCERSVAPGLSRLGLPPAVYVSDGLGLRK